MSPRRRTPPHLPFLDGPASFAPELKPIPPADWLLPDTEVSAWLNDKRLLIKLMRDKVSAGIIDGPAAEEVLNLVLQATGLTPNQSLPTALEEAASIITDDLCIMEEERRGDWRFVAGVVCAPTYWHLTERIGMDLGGLHGPVPGGDPQLAGRIGRILSALKPGAILQRFNWTVQVSDKRYTPERPSVAGQGIHDLHLRVERQTIRKLEQTGAVLFSIRTCVDPLVPILKSPDTREAFEDAWLGTAPVVRRYKGWDRLEDLVATACRQADQAVL